MCFCVKKKKKFLYGELLNVIFAVIFKVKLASCRRSSGI